jgi:hypothetical protein
MNSNTEMKRHSSGFMSVFISLTMLFFGLLTALFLLHAVFGIFMFVAGFAGFIVAGMGGYRYLKADNEAEKLGAMTWVAAGLALIVVRFIIF